MMQGLLVTVLLCVVIGSAWAGSYDGLYFSNGTHIFYAADPETGTSQAVYNSAEGRIVGLAFSEQANLLFWSDIQGDGRGIWRGTLAGSTLSGVQHIIDTDIIEINGLTVDWVSKHIYWMDARKVSIELADFDGNNRRILPITGLVNPRGIHADPINGYLYWNDQGSKKIERSLLDGSNREELVTGKLPNEMGVSGSNVYFLDAEDSTLRSFPMSGTPTVSTVATIDSPDYAVFGLAISNGIAYVSSWNGKIHSLSVPGGTNRKTPLANIGTGVVFSVVYVAQQEAGTSPCAQANKNGCSHLCLPMAGSLARCACPSYGGSVLQADAKNCASPTKYLFFALGDEGQIGYLNVDNPADKDRYLVGRSLRPVAVTYDPIDQFVYWSDVHEHSIHRAKADGSQHIIFMGFNHSIGVVDGLAVDYVDRRLYYSNMGHVMLGGVAYTWHKIEAADMADPNTRRTVVETAERPRGLYIDSEKRYVYYTDWGDNAAVIRTEMDGSNPTRIKTGLDNPNGITVQNGKIVVVDSHVKSRESQNPGRQAKPAAIYSSSLVGESWTTYTSGINLMIPFGVTAVGSKLYVSDWDRDAILAFTTGSSTEEVIMEGVSSPMGLFYSLKTSSPSAKCSLQCDTGLCIGQHTGSTPKSVCACNSYDAEVYVSTNQCNVPNKFLLFADFNSIKMVGMEGEDLSVYTVFQGNRYFSNFVGLTYKEDTNTVYFSEQNRRGVFYAKLDGSASGTYYEVDHVIDGMTLDPAGTRLYWTDYEGGKIASQAIPQGNDTYREFATGLSKPRDIAVTANHIYWTEWGSNPRVGRADLNGANAVSLVTEVDGVSLRYPNALYVDSANNKLYIGERSDKKFIRCDIDGTNCAVLNYATSKFNHIYDLVVSGNWMIYSDWEEESVSMVSMTTDQVIELASGVMRPTQMYLRYPTTPTCPANHGCGDACVPYPGGYTCRCNLGRVPKKDQPKLCEEAYQDLVPADDPSQCASDCGSQKICAHEVGGTSFSCTCKSGHELLSGNCSPCAKNKYKSGVGDGPCTPCPAGADTQGSGSTGCKCPTGFVWDTKNETCLAGSTKSGQCPTLSAPFSAALSSCPQSCSDDTACSGSKKCCSYSVDANCNNVLTCVDPVGLSECSHEGKLYLIGQSFQPNSCTSCKCEYDRYLGDPRYGNAVCDIQSCPALPCAKQDQKVTAGKCCATCTSNSTGIEIVNCPALLVKKALPEDKNFYEYSFAPTVKDHYSQTERDYQVSPSTARTLFWTKEPQVIKYTVTASNPVHTDSCTIRVSLLDLHAPRMTCPGNQKLYTSADTGRGTWDPPTVSEYGSGIATGYPVSNPVYGNQLTVGPHNVQYTVKDRAGNENACSFVMTVVKETLSTCPVPKVKSGFLDCTENTASQEKSCTLKCVAGHNPFSSETTYTCKNDQWTPTLIDNFEYFACVQTQSKSLFGRLIVTSQCTEDLQITRQQIIEHIKARYLYANNNPFDLSVLVSGCSDGKPMEVDVQLSAASGTSQDANDLNAILDKIKNDIKNGLFQSIIPGDPTVTGTGATTRCLPGYQPHGAQCAKCPFGTRYDEGTEKCVLCPAGSYQDEQGQLRCKPCEASGMACTCDGSGSAETGLSNPAQCSAVPCDNCGGLPVWAIIIIVVGILVILAIVILVVVIVRRRQSSKPPTSLNGTNGTSHPNQAFGEEGEYDEIPDGREKPTNGIGTGQENPDNHYESPDKNNMNEKNHYSQIKA